MAKRKYSSEEIIHKLREADVLLGQGKTILEACKQLGVTDQTPTSAGARPTAA